MYVEYQYNKDINFKFKSGDFVTFLGDLNDNFINNLIYKYDNNFISIDGIKANKDKLRKLVGLSSFSISLNVYISETVMDSLAFPLESMALNKKEMKDRIYDMAEELKITDLLDKPPSTLTLSNRTKLSIGEVLISEPKILILDNVLVCLDEDDRFLVEKIIKKYVSKGNIVFNFTSNIEEGLLGDYIVISNKDKILIQGSTVSVLNEEDIIKKLGYKLPFIVEVNKRLYDLGLIESYNFSYQGLVMKLWK